MNRRTLLTVIGGSVLAGCTAWPAEERSEDNSQNDTSETTYAQPKTRLKIRSSAETEHRFSFRLEHHETKEVAYDAKKTIAPNGFVRLDEAFSPGVDYQFTISHKNHEIFSLVIYSYEGYILDIKSNTEVKVARHVEV